MYVLLSDTPNFRCPGFDVRIFLLLYPKHDYNFSYHYYTLKSSQLTAIKIGVGGCMEQTGDGVVYRYTFCQVEQHLLHFEITP